MIDKEQAQHMTDVAGECNRLNEISQPLGYADCTRRQHLSCAALALCRSFSPSHRHLTDRIHCELLTASGASDWTEMFAHYLQTPLVDFPVWSG